MPLTDTAANQLLLYYLTGTAIAGQSVPPTYGSNSSLYVGLSIDLIQPDGTGMREPLTARGYTRKSIARSSAGWSSAADGILSNLDDIQFNKATGSWETIRSFFISDSSARAGGNIIYHQAIVPPIPVATSTVVKILAENIVIRRNSAPYGTE